MSIAVACSCGARFKAKSELAGRRVKCPSCDRPMTLPQSQSQPESRLAAEKIRVRCDCGQVLQAKTELVGKQVKCPVCRQVLSIPKRTPVQPVSVEPLASDKPSADDPLGLGSLADDPLGLGDIDAATSGRQLASSSTPFATKVSSPTKSRRAPRPKRKLTRLAIAAGIMSIVHFVFHLSLLAISFLLRTDAAPPSANIQPGYMQHAELILHVIQWGASIGILIGGIGVLARQSWGLRIGAPAAGIYFALLAVGAVLFLVEFVSLMNQAAGNVNPAFLVGFLIGVTIALLPILLLAIPGPAMLITLHQKRR